MAKPLSAKEKMQQQLRERIKQSEETGKQSLFTSNRYYKVPDGMEAWRPKADKKGSKACKHSVDIIPFQAGKHYPTRNSYSIQEGDYHYVLDIKVHRNVGPENIWVVCPLANYNEPCPICEHAKELYANSTSEAETKKISQEKYPKRRNIFNVVVYDNDEEEQKGVQIWEDAHFFVGKNLEEEANKNEDGDGLILFYMPDSDGRRVNFEIHQKTEKEIEYTMFFFKKRNYEIDQDILDQAVCLDDLIADNLLSYQELYDLYWQNEGKTEPKKRKEKKSEEDEEEETTTKRGRKATSDEDDEQEEETKTTKRSRRSIKTETVEEEEEETNTNPCNFGHEFGKDHIKKSHLKDCEKCEEEDFYACEKELKRLKQEETDRIKREKKKRDEESEEDEETEKKPPKRRRVLSDD